MVELKLNVKKQNIQAFNDVFDEDKARSLAAENKRKAFGMMSSLFDRNEHLVLTHIEKRYEPFWHITGEGYVEYLRKNNYGFNVDSQVRSVKIADHVFEITGDKPYCGFEAEDHCVEIAKKELLTDAVEGKQEAKALKRYLDLSTHTIDQTEELMGENKVVVPAKIKAAFLIRNFVKELIRPVHADKILQETIEIKKVVLYFRPIYAFEFTNSKNKKAGVLEVDALTGDVAKGKMYKTSLKELIPEGTLFDIGVDVVSNMLPIPGVGAIGTAIYKSKKKKSEDKRLKKEMDRSRDAMEEKHAKKSKKKAE